MNARWNCQVVKSFSLLILITVIGCHETQDSEHSSIRADETQVDSKEKYVVPKVVPLIEEYVQKDLRPLISEETTKFRSYVSRGNEPDSWLKIRSIRNLGDFQDFKSMAQLEAYAQSSDAPRSVAFADLSWGYLTLGRFDSAENALAKVNSGTGKHEIPKDIVQSLQKHIEDVRQALSESTAAVSSKQSDISYPHKEIFLHALMQTEPEEEYLRLNIADAWLSAFPDSVVAKRYVIHFNLSHLENLAAHNDVPAIRSQVAFPRAYSVAISLKNHPKAVVYAGTRFAVYFLRRYEKYDYRSAYYFGEQGIDILRNAANAKPAPPGQSKALINYALTMYYLKARWTRTGFLKEIMLPMMEEAVQLEPNVEAYTSLLARLQEEGSIIERDTLLAEKRRSQEATQRIQSRNQELHRESISGQDAINRFMAVAAAGLAAAVLYQAITQGPDDRASSRSGSNSFGGSSQDSGIHVPKTCEYCWGSRYTRNYSGRMTPCIGCGGSGLRY